MSSCSLNVLMSLWRSHSPSGQCLTVFAPCHGKKNKQNKKPNTHPFRISHSPACVHCLQTSHREPPRRLALSLFTPTRHVKTATRYPLSRLERSHSPSFHTLCSIPLTSLMTSAGPTRVPVFFLRWGAQNKTQHSRGSLITVSQ